MNQRQAFKALSWFSTSTKPKLSLYLSTMSWRCTGRVVKAPDILNLGTRWKCVASITPPPPPGKEPTLGRRSGETESGLHVLERRNPCPYRESKCDRPACNGWAVTGSTKMYRYSCVWLYQSAWRIGLPCGDELHMVHKMDGLELRRTAERLI